LSGLAGPSPYDLSGTGTGFVAALELTWRPASGLVVEPGMTYFTYESQFSERIHYLMNGNTADILFGLSGRLQ
jgi:hypothetical protein